jgi:hypothetical protein
MHSVIDGKFVPMNFGLCRVVCSFVVMKNLYFVLSLRMVVLSA